MKLIVARKAVALISIVLLLCSSAMADQSSPQAIKVVVNISHQNVKHFIPVTAYVNPAKFTIAKANTEDKKIAYIIRILHNNTHNLSMVTKNFTRYNDVRLYLGVNYNPGSDAHIHMAKSIGAKKICGRICMKNANRKQCCAIIICPGNCEC